MEGWVTIFGALGVVVGACAYTFALAKNKGFEAQTRTADSWKSAFDAKEVELGIVRKEKQDISMSLHTSQLKIVELEGRIKILEARPDLQQISESLEEIRRQDDERTLAANEKMAEHFKVLQDETREYHEAQIAALQMITSLLASQKEVN
jgi:hypothetical protein